MLTISSIECPVDEAAELVSLSPRTLLRAIRAGHLVASQLNENRGGWRILESAIWEWMDGRANVKRSPRPIAALRRIDPEPSPRRPRRRPGVSTGRLVP